jgi:hypothetical protein
MELAVRNESKPEKLSSQSFSEKAFPFLNNLRDVLWSF